MRVTGETVVETSWNNRLVALAMTSAAVSVGSGNRRCDQVPFPRSETRVLVETAGGSPSTGEAIFHSNR